MIADETDQEASLDSTLEVPQDLRDRTATILQKLQNTGDGEEFYLEIVHDLVTLCDATQLILYAVDREDGPSMSSSPGSHAPEGGLNRYPLRQTTYWAIALYAAKC